MHPLDAKAEPHTGGMTFLGRGRAKSSPQLPWRLAHTVLAQQLAGDYLVGRILCFDLKEAKFNHLFGRLQRASLTTQPQRAETEEELRLLTECKGQISHFLFIFFLRS